MSIESLIPVTARSGNFHLGPINLGRLDDGCIVVAGNNGAGKSTLFNVLAREVRATVHLLPQTFTLPPLARVRDLAYFVASQRGVSPDEAESAIDKVGLSDKAQARVRTLSGGMHRRLGIALTLIGNPELLIVDEPTAGLDVEQRSDVIEILRVASEQRVVMLASHLVADIEELADRILLLDRGHLIFDGTRDDFIGSHGSFEDAYKRRLRSV